MSGYKSSLRMEPMGPNPELCKGPDPTLLLSAYAQRLGPNKANRCGPQVRINDSLRAPEGVGWWELRPYLGTFLEKMCIKPNTENFKFLKY